MVHVGIGGAAFVAGRGTSCERLRRRWWRTLTVSSGGVSADITLLGQYLQGNFKISDDTHGGTLVADPPVVAQTDLLVNPHST
jgi:hypothetical protein